MSSGRGQGGGDPEGVGGAGWAMAKGKNCDNCNGIINKIQVGEKKRRLEFSAPPQFPRQGEGLQTELTDNGRRLNQSQLGNETSIKTAGQPLGPSVESSHEPLHQALGSIRGEAPPSGTLSHVSLHQAVGLYPLIISEINR